MQNQLLNFFIFVAIEIGPKIKNLKETISVFWCQLGNEHFVFGSFSVCLCLRLTKRELFSVLGENVCQWLLLQFVLLVWHLSMWGKKNPQRWTLAEAWFKSGHCSKAVIVLFDCREHVERTGLLLHETRTLMMEIFAGEWEWKTNSGVGCFVGKTLSCTGSDRMRVHSYLRPAHTPNLVPGSLIFASFLELKKDRTIQYTVQLGKN